MLSLLINSDLTLAVLFISADNFSSSAIEPALTAKKESHNS